MPSLGRSDHEIVISRPLARAHLSTIPSQKKIKVRTGNTSDTVNAIRNINWDVVMPGSIDAQSATDAFYKAINDAVENC